MKTSRLKQSCLVVMVSAFCMSFFSCQLLMLSADNEDLGFESMIVDSTNTLIERTDTSNETISAATEVFTMVTETGSAVISADTEIPSAEEPSDLAFCLDAYMNLNRSEDSSTQTPYLKKTDIKAFDSLVYDVGMIPPYIISANSSISYYICGGQRT